MIFDVTCGTLSVFKGLNNPGPQAGQESKTVIYFPTSGKIILYIFLKFSFGYSGPQTRTFL